MPARMAEISRHEKQMIVSLVVCMMISEKKRILGWETAKNKKHEHAIKVLEKKKKTIN